jgi:hypothetical protein
MYVKATGYWLLAADSTFVSSGLLKRVQDDDVRKPFTVYRPSHLMANKVLTHGLRLTVNGYTVSGEMDAQIASSQKPGASSNLAPDKTAKQISVKHG